ncbi:MAG: AI-2E family transporter [Patescibacteria group bacterium]
MDKDILQRYFFMGALFIVTVIIFLIFLPFFEVILLSIIFAVALEPLHKRLTRKLNGRNGLAAILVVILFAVVIITPAVFLSTQVMSESKGLYDSLVSGDANFLESVTSAIEKPIQKIYPGFYLDIREYVSFGADIVTSHLSSILSSVISIVTGIILIFISLYFFLKDGRSFKKVLIDLSPLSDKYDEHIWDKVKTSITATVSGVILVAIVQGLLAGFGLWLFGIPSATLWGSIAAIASLVPGLGTAIVFIPAVIYMLVIGNTPYAIGLVIWGGVIVGLVDNFLTPYLYSRKVEIHQLIMLFAVLGGLIAFGPIGFLFGPIALSLFFSMIEIYRTLILEKKEI